jgi:IS4 transposase
MVLGKIFDRFVDGSPVTVMLRGTLDYALRPDELDGLFSRAAQRQYTRELLFSAVVDLMSLVVCRVRPSVHAAYQADPGSIGVSVRALYDKLDHLEPGISAALVHHVAERLVPVVRAMRGGARRRLPGYRVRILDGNHLAGTEHRLKELRGVREAALPGLVLVTYDPEWMVITDVIPCEDGHAQERALLGQALPLVQPKDAWVADRNFCTTAFLFGVARRRAFFAVRQHGQTLTWERVGKRRYRGRTDTGKVFEQAVELRDSGGGTLKARRITVELDKPTRDGDTEIHVLTNVPPVDADALAVAELYRGRWTIEAAFAEIAAVLSNEIDTLAYPRAALFGFCVGLVAYGVLSVIKGALRAAHGAAKVEEEVSGYYLADELAGTYRGMMIAIPARHWRVFGRMSVAGLARVLKELAGKLRLAAFRKHPRGPKKAVGKKKARADKGTHVATVRLVEKRKRVAN